MKTVVKHIVVLVYNSYRDPLCSNFFMSYLKPFCDGRYHFHLITFEQKEYAIDESDRKKITADLQSKHISWHPMKYMSGRFILAKKLLNFLAAFLKIGSIRLRHGAPLMLSMSNVAGSMAYLCTRILAMKNCILIYEPHAQFLADFGIWKKSGMKYKLLNYLEQRAGRKSEFIITGTVHLRDELAPIARGKIFRAPSAVDENVFRFSATSREQIRMRIGIEETQPAIIYAGKFGGLYYEKEIPEFVSKLQRIIPGLFFIVITRQDHSEVRDLIQPFMQDEKCFHLAGASTPWEMAAWYSAADIGLSGVPSLPSQKYRSPVKVGEYLMCGLPYITCRGVSEDDLIAQKENVGVVVENFSGAEMNSVAEHIRLFLKEDKTALRSRCRASGIAYRGMHNVTPILKDILEHA